MRHIALALLLASCNASGEPGGPGPGSSPSASAAVGSGGADGSGGGASVVASASSAGGAASSSQLSVGTGTGGHDGGSGGHGGTGGEAPVCPSADCPPMPGVWCESPTCANGLDCSGAVCAPEGSAAVLPAITSGAFSIGLPPIAGNDAACSVVCPAMAWAVRIPISAADYPASCFTVEAPPGVVWDVVVENGVEPRACPNVLRGCDVLRLEATGETRSLVLGYEAGTVSNGVTVHVIPGILSDAACAPPDCATGCNGEGA